MSSTDWETITANLDTTEDVWLQWWFNMEQKWGELGTPGISRISSPVRWERIFGHNEMEPVEWYLYRGEDGRLLGVYAYYIKDGQPKPVILNVHPDNQRQGIATQLIDKSLEDFGDGYNFKQQTRDMDLTEASANFGNKYAQNKLGIETT
jgi:GNAT superfamily N-acetyltransferase